MSDLPPRPATRELPTLEQALNYPQPESVSKWGEEIEVRFEDTSGTQGSKPTGYVNVTKEGTRWDRAAKEAFGIPMQAVDTRTEIKGDSNVVLKCRPVFGSDEMTAPVSAPGRRQFSLFPLLPTTHFTHSTPRSAEVPTSRIVDRALQDASEARRDCIASIYR
jgi:hypothetical protein